MNLFSFIGELFRAAPVRMSLVLILFGLSVHFSFSTSQQIPAFFLPIFLMVILLQEASFSVAQERTKKFIETMNETFNRVCVKYQERLNKDIEQLSVQAGITSHEIDLDQMKKSEVH